jgi:D-glycero-alpha-D-manno-heptose-7-phosphate kinase
MIVTRTPFRIPLGGGSTDLSAYYEKHGGFIFAVTINLYMYIAVNRSPVDDLIHIKYRESEAVEKLSSLKHNLARGALTRTGFNKMIEISSMADVPDGTGLGSSGSYLVGLLNALHTLKGEKISRRQLAEEAFEIATKDLGLPDGKQDFYASSFGNFSVLEIGKDGKVVVSNAKISNKTQKKFEERTLLFYTGVRRSSVDILRDQQKKIKKNEKTALALKHKIKEIGRKIHRAFENDDLDLFGRLMDEHWEVKKQMSPKMSSDLFEEVYKRAKNKGVIGGKIMGAGGGGFFLVYCKNGTQKAVRKVFGVYKMREIPIKVDAGGTQVLLNRPRIVSTI